MNLNITEKDIFDFVYYKENLDNEKSDFINSHLHEFHKVIEFYSDFKNEIDIQVSEDVVSITNNFGDTKNLIRLLPVIEEKNELPEKYKLAANSLNVTGNISITKFKDIDSRFIIRVISSTDITKIFVFAPNDCVLSEFDITLLPSNHKFKYNKEKSYVEFQESLIIHEIQIIA